LKSPKFNCSPDVKLRKAAYSDNLNKNRLGVGHFPTENFKSELDDSPPIKYKNTEEAGKPIFKINLFQYTHDKEGSLTENEKQGSQAQAGN